MRRLSTLLAALLTGGLAGCASPADRIAGALTSYGVPDKEAKCMGQRLQDRLSYAQLNRLNELAKLNRDRVGRLSINALADQLNRDGDPKLVAQVVRAGLHCAL